MQKLSLKEIQQTELDIMIEFDKIARRHNLKYALCAGTLIGAVRHQGFIPWDDDIDVTMPRPDYEKLILLNKEQQLWPSYLELKSFEDGTLEAPFAKLFDTRTKVVEHNFTQNDVQSLWIDIFPVDGLPDDKQAIKKHYKKANRLVRMNVASVVRAGYGANLAIIIVKDLFLRPIARLQGRRKISAKMREHAFKYPYESSPLCGMVTWPCDGPGQALTKEEYETLIEVPFEDHSFYIMSGWDKNLTGIFGDYMTPPPENERLTHELEAYRL